MQQIMALSTATTELYSTAALRPFQVGYLEWEEVSSKEKPGALIYTMEFNRIGTEYSCIIKDREGRVSINIKVDLDPEGTGTANDRNSSN